MEKKPNDIQEKAQDATAQGGLEEPHRELGFLLDIPLQVSVEVGRSRILISELLQMREGYVLELDKLAGEPLDLYVNSRLIARGEAVLLQRPRVVKDLCIGCGICEYQCPMGGEAAVRVYTWTEASPYGISIGG